MTKEKKCTKCRKIKSINEFHKQRASKDGYKRICKLCVKVYIKTSKARKSHKKVNLIYSRSKKGKDAQKNYNRTAKRKASLKKYQQTDKAKARSKRYSATDKGKETLRKSVERYAKKYPHKRKAKKAVSHAVERGELPNVITKSCTDCGKQAQHYHHESYDRKDWLNVIPLCAKCHKQRHQ